jgi:hypothetical protein
LGLENLQDEPEYINFRDGKVKENMSSVDEFDDYEIGYGKPPKSGQFKKGISGNPSGRPKKPTDSVSVLMRELDSKFTINESGQRKVIRSLGEYGNSR